MPIKPPQAAPVTGFRFGTKKATETLPVRTLIVNTAAKFGSYEYERAVIAAALAAKQEEQQVLKEQFRKGFNDTQSDFD